MRLYKHALFTACDQCVMFKQIRSLVGDDNPQALEELNEKRQKHWDYVTAARRRMLERTAFARSHKDEVLMVNVDGMDQAKTNIPNEPLKDKSTSAGAPLPIRLMGAIAYARAWYGFWTIPQWASTSNVTLTALSRIIQDAQVDGRSRGLPAPHLPPRLVLQMDNTAKDNKNHFLFGFAGMLLAEGYFTEVEAHFLPVGHTHQEIDQSFSLVSKAVGERGALDLDDLVDVADGAWRRLDYVGTDVKVQVKLSAVDDYRRVMRYESSARRVVGGCGGDSMAATSPQDRNMHHFTGLGTERWEDEENEVSRRWDPGDDCLVGTTVHTMTPTSALSKLTMRACPPLHQPTHCPLHSGQSARRALSTQQYHPNVHYLSKHRRSSNVLRSLIGFAFNAWLVQALPCLQVSQRGRQARGVRTRT